MDPISILLAITFLQLQIWSVKSENVTEKQELINCQVCGPGVGPNYGCDFHTKKSEDAVVKDGCEHCGIWEEWGLNSDNEWRMLVRRRICLVGEIELGCTYWYPAGTKGNVHEICKCHNVTFTCNSFVSNPKFYAPNVKITDIGGMGHPSKFPPQKRNGEVVLKVVNGADPRVIGVIYSFISLVPLILLSYKYSLLVFPIFNLT